MKLLLKSNLVFMKKTYFILFVILLLSFTVKIFAQPEVLEGSVKSPGLADMIRYGKTSVSMYSGRLDLQIPLTVVEDKDFSFPISLSYNSSGFMPAKNDGLVGLNWSLSCGGFIRREVKGIPDDKPIYYNSEGPTEYGFMYFLKNKNKLIHKNVVENPDSYMAEGDFFTIGEDWTRMKINSFENNLRDKLDVLDASSDIYHFSFGDHSGKFTIKFDGSVNVISNDGRKYDIDLSDYSYATFNGESKASKIVITTDDGYKYIFGGTYDAMEYSLQWQHAKPNAGGGNWDGFYNLMKSGYFYITISSFNISQIIAPSGRTLDIEYKKLPPEYYCISGDKMYNALVSEKANQFNDFFFQRAIHYFFRKSMQQTILYLVLL